MTTFEDSYDVPPIQIIAERQRGMARTIGDFVKWRREVDQDRTAFDIKIDALVSDVRTVKRLLIGLLVTAVTGSVSVTIAVLIATGKHP